MQLIPHPTLFPAAPPPIVEAMEELIEADTIIDPQSKQLILHPTLSRVASPSIVNINAESIEAVEELIKADTIIDLQSVRLTVHPTRSCAAPTSNVETYASFIGPLPLPRKVLAVTLATPALPRLPMSRLYTTPNIDPRNMLSARAPSTAIVKTSNAKEGYAVLRPQAVVEEEIENTDSKAVKDTNQQQPGKCLTTLSPSHPKIPFHIGHLPLVFAIPPEAVALLSLTYFLQCCLYRLNLSLPQPSLRSLKRRPRQEAPPPKSR